MKLDVTRTVKKSNLLNEVRNATTSLVEYRLFCVYLAHLPINSESNVVTFKLADYAKIAGLDRPRYIDLKSQADNIVATTASLPNPDGGFSTYSLFSEFRLYKDNDEWTVSLECNPKLAPMIREQRGRFLRYKLYNTIRLKSFNQQRLYELLKQYEKIGERTIPLEDLREFLSIGSDEYPVWGDLSQKVLKVAQKALRESTDICFEFDPVKKKNKTIAVKFTIKKNPGFIDQLQIDPFLPDIDDVEFEDSGEIVVTAEEPKQISMFEETEEGEYAFFRGSLSRSAELSDGQMSVIIENVKLNSWYQSIPFYFGVDETNKAIYHYLKHQDVEVCSRPIKESYFAILKAACRNNYAKVPEYENDGDAHSFDTDEFMDAALKKSYSGL